MTARLQRPTPLIVGAVALLVLVGGLGLAATRSTGTQQVEVAMIAVAAASAVLVVPLVDPALPIVAGLVLSIFSGWWSQIGLSQGLDRPLLLYGIFGALLTTLPDAPNRRTYSARAVHWLMATTALYAIGSAVFAGTITQQEPIFALSERLGIVGFLLFAVAPLVFHEQRSRDKLLIALIALGAYLAITAIMESTSLHTKVVPKYIDNSSIGIHYGRARGPFLEAGADGMVMYASLVAACIGWFRWRSAGVRSLCVAVVLLCGVGIVLTLTRQVWIGAGLGTVVAMALTPKLRLYLLPAAAVIAIAVAGGLALSPSLQGKIHDRAHDQKSVWDRLNSDRAAIDMIEARPLFGWGWYKFGEVSPSFLQQAADYPLSTVPRPHNVFLANGAELGLVGSALWLVAMLLAIGTAALVRAPPDLEPWRVGLIAVSVNWIIVANLTPLGYALPNHLLWLWPGIVWSAVLAPNASFMWSSRPLRSTRPAAASSLV